MLYTTWEARTSLPICQTVCFTDDFYERKRHESVKYRAHWRSKGFSMVVSVVSKETRVPTSKVDGLIRRPSSFSSYWTSEEQALTISNHLLLQSLLTCFLDFVKSSKNPQQKWNCPYLWYIVSLSWVYFKTQFDWIELLSRRTRPVGIAFAIDSIHLIHYKYSMPLLEVEMSLGKGT